MSSSEFTPEDEAQLARLEAEQELLTPSGVALPEGTTVEQQAAVAATQPPAAPPPAPAPEPAPPPTSAAPAPAPAAPAAPAPAPPQGDVRAALRASRQAERRATAEAERLRRENEELRQRAEAAAPAQPDALARIEQDFPEVAAVVRPLVETVQKLAQPAPPATAEPEFTPEPQAPEVQDLIDDIPLLAGWQSSKDTYHLFQATALEDQKLRMLPTWRDRPMAERFQEAARRVASEAGLAAAPPAAAPSAPPPPARDPAEVIAAAPPAPNRPVTVNDFGTGAGAPPVGDWTRFKDKSDEDIFRSLEAG